ncbi:MAG: sigma-54 dependent transcriptional regulator, partial [Acidobacteriota bacterium]
GGGHGLPPPATRGVPRRPGLMRLLLVEDDPDVAYANQRRLALKGHHIQTVGTGAEALRSVERQVFDAVLLDLGLPDGDGLGVLEELMRIDPESRVIVFTGRDEASSAVAALRLGAADYVVKSSPGELLDHALAKVSEVGLLSRRLESMGRRSDPELVGQAPNFRRALDVLRAAAAAPRSPVLIVGESGTGKERAATRIHAWSDRAHGPFVTANIAAIPSSLLEAELFGHEAGAFTGASTARRGLFELAAGGVLFLDEIGELLPEIQPKLLRVIEGHPFRRLGSEREIQCDVRLVTATHRRLADEVAAGRFREDLYHRIRVLEIDMPPLRERGGDIEMLAEHFLGSLAIELGQEKRTISPEACGRLRSYGWPGNVRELRNVLESALVLGRGRRIEAAHLPPYLGAGPAAIQNAAVGVPELRPALDASGASSGSSASADEEIGSVTLDEAMRRHVERVVASCGGNLTHAAQALGISRGTLRRRRRRWRGGAD